MTAHVETELNRVKTLFSCEKKLQSTGDEYHQSHRRNFYLISGKERLLHLSPELEVALIASVQKL